MRAQDRDEFERFFEAWFPRVHAFASKRLPPQAARAATEVALRRAVEGAWPPGPEAELASLLLSLLKADIAERVAAEEESAPKSMQQPLGAAQ